MTRWIYLALSRAQEETETTTTEATTTEAADLAGDGEPDEATGQDAEAPADDEKSKGKGKSSAGGVVGDILTFMKDTCAKIIKYISGKADGGSESAGKPAGDEAVTTTEATAVKDAKNKAGKKTKKGLDKIKTVLKGKDSEESEEWISFI